MSTAGRTYRGLHVTAMPVGEIADYAQLVREGDGTVAQRRRVLEAHRERVRRADDELTEALAVLDRKIEHYEAAEYGVDVGCSDDPPLGQAAKIGCPEDRLAPDDDDVAVAGDRRGSSNDGASCSRFIGGLADRRHRGSAIPPEPPPTCRMALVIVCDGADGESGGEWSCGAG